jgi:hypothetical protein
MSFVSFLRLSGSVMVLKKGKKISAKGAKKM